MSVSLLEEFVHSLDKSERAKLKPLKFRGKKRQMMFSLLKLKSRTPNSTRPSSKKKVSVPGIHSMRAELLQYVYDEICPKGGIELLNFLVDRGLYRHFSRELTAVENNLLIERNPHTLEKFYFEVFKLIFSIPLARLTSDQVWAKLREYPQKYIDCKRVKHPHDKLLPELFNLGLDMRQAIIEHRPPELLARIENCLHTIYTRTHGTDNLMLRIILNRRMIVFYKNIKIDFEQVQKYYDAESIYFSEDPSVAEFIPVDLSNLYAGELAYFRADFTSAYNYFLAEYQRKQHPLRSWAVAYAQMFVLVCQAKREFKQSEIILQERFLYFLDFHHSPHAVLTCVLLARQYFYQKDYTRALEYVTIGYQRNAGSLFDPVHDLDLKILETAIVAIEGSFMKAHDLAQANVRVCARRGYKLSSSRLPHFFKFIEEMSDAYLSNIPLRKKTIERLSKFPPPYTYPKVLLEQICEKYLPNSSL